VWANCEAGYQGEIQRLQADGTWQVGQHLYDCGGCPLDLPSDAPPTTLNSATYRVCGPANKYAIPCTKPTVVLIDRTSSLGGGGTSGGGGTGSIGPGGGCMVNPIACPSPSGYGKPKS
jgi:hypothetical protein